MNQSVPIKSFDLLLVAASTGGPVALEKLFSGFSRPLRQPVLVVQHMPPEFTRILAQNLDKKSPLAFAEAKAGDIVAPGKAFIAPGGWHMLVKKNGVGQKQIELNTEPLVNGVRPAADVLFLSVAKVYSQASVLTVILTGMGSDGTKGVLALKQACLCHCITQSAESCVVYGMPRSVYDAGLANEVLPVERMAARIEALLTGKT